MYQKKGYKSVVNVHNSGVDPGFGQGGSAFEAKSCKCSRVELHKYVFSHILETLFFSYLTSPKADKN